MNQIKDVYARISADESVVNTAIEKAKQQKIKRLPVGRIAAIAAGFIVAIAVSAALVFSLQPKLRTSEMAAAGQYEEEKAGAAEQLSPEAQNEYDSGYSASDSAAEDIAVISAVASKNTAVEYHLTKKSGYLPEELTLRVEDEQGQSVEKLSKDAPRSDGEGGWYVTEYFERAETQTITCKFYSGETLIREETVNLI